MSRKVDITTATAADEAEALVAAAATDLQQLCEANHNLLFNMPTGQDEEPPAKRAKSDITDTVG